MVLKRCGDIETYKYTTKSEGSFELGRIIKILEILEISLILLLNKLYMI